MVLNSLNKKFKGFRAGLPEVCGLFWYVDYFEWKTIENLKNLDWGLVYMRVIIRNDFL